MSCEGHRRKAIAAIVAAYAAARPTLGPPGATGAGQGQGQGALTAEDAERIYQAYRRTPDGRTVIYDHVDAGIAEKIVSVAAPDAGAVEPYRLGRLAALGTDAVPDEIEQRWRDRVLRNGWEKAGEKGADEYLAKYGRGIGAPKVIQLARCAEMHGFPDIARGFWKAAYTLDTPALRQGRAVAETLKAVEGVLGPDMPQPSATPVSVEVPEPPKLKCRHCGSVLDTQGQCPSDDCPGRRLAETLAPPGHADVVAAPDDAVTAPFKQLFDLAAAGELSVDQAESLAGELNRLYGEQGRQPFASGQVQIVKGDDGAYRVQAPDTATRTDGKTTDQANGGHGNRCRECGNFISKNGQDGHKPWCSVIGGPGQAAAPSPAKAGADEFMGVPAFDELARRYHQPDAEAAIAPALPRPVYVGRAPTPAKDMTDQEHVLQHVRLPAPDPYRSAIPADLGGGLDEPADLDVFIPPVDPGFEMNEDTERALRTISAALQTGDPEFQNFYLAGKPGSGKNTILRQVAASTRTIAPDGTLRQGIPYLQWDITEDTNVEELIGGTALVERNGTTVTVWKPGPLAAALMHGTCLVALNEIVRKPKAATLLQAIMEDREIQVKTPDGGLVRVPVGDGAIVAMTGNPGHDRDPDRPGAAAFTRTIPIKIEYGSKETRASRALSRYNRRLGLGPGGKASRNGQAPKPINVRGFDYKIRRDPLHEKELRACVDFMDELEVMIEGAQRSLQVRTGGGKPVVPGPRGLDRFIAIGKATGDWRQALEMIKPYLTQDPAQYEDEWKLVQTLFERKFVLNADGSFQV